MSKDSRFKYEYRKNASKLHRTVGEILRTDKRLRNYDSYQEYPVNRVNTFYDEGSHHFDWVIPKLKLVIECHGQQHYKVVAFGGDVDKAVDAFHATKRRDKKKMEAALDANYRYIVIPYTIGNTVTGDTILGMINEAEKTLGVHKLEHFEDSSELPTKWELARGKQKERNQAQRKEFLASDKHQERLRAAKEARKEQYKRAKERKNGSR